MNYPWKSFYIKYDDGAMAHESSARNPKNA